jgi:beta-galactosidase beta subunit
MIVVSVYKTADSRQQDSRQQTADSGQQTADSRLQTDSRRQTADLHRESHALVQGGVQHQPLCLVRSQHQLNVVKSVVTILSQCCYGVDRTHAEILLLSAV